jgi:hypothetical protein
MRLGRRIFAPLRRRPLVVASAALAVIVAIWSVAAISLVPPGLAPRSLEMASGTTHVVVDTPRSSLLDLRQDTYSLEALTQRAILLGNVMANGQVQKAIAKRADVPVESLQVTPPLTPTQPEALVGSANQKHATDILKSTDQYRLDIQANPTVPMLDIYSEAPTAGSATLLANAAVGELRHYLGQLAAAQRTPASQRIRLIELGRAHGDVVNVGIDYQLGLVAFVLTFFVAYAILVFLSRVRQRWQTAALSERAARG